MAQQAQSAGVNGAVIAAIIVAGASLVTTSFSWFSSRQAQKAVRTHRAQDYRIRQQNELYGPLYMWRLLSRRLWEQLTEIPNAQPGVTPWKLIDHIEEIKSEADGRRRLVVEEILKINAELTDLIVGKAGLLYELPPPESFEKFLEHSRMLRINWDQGTNATGISYRPFPGEIDQDILHALEGLRRDIQQ